MITRRILLLAPLLPVPAWAQSAASEVVERFHAALIGACDSPMLMEMRQSLHDASELYRRLAYLTQRGQKDTAYEHRLLMEAALAGVVDAGVSRKRLRIAHDAALAVDAGVVARTQKSPDSIKAAVAEARLAAIRSAIE